MFRFALYPPAVSIATSDVQTSRFKIYGLETGTTDFVGQIRTSLSLTTQLHIVFHQLMTCVALTTRSSFVIQANKQDSISIKKSSYLLLQLLLALEIHNSSRSLIIHILCSN